MSVDRPHLLLICCDHLPAALLESPEGDLIRWSNLRHLLRCGRYFRRCYSESPLCIPARRTILTGQEPRRHGVNAYMPGKPLPPVPTIASALRDAGYQTGAVGKLHIDPMRARAGFEEVRLHEEGRGGLAEPDDYEWFLQDEGFAGQQFAHGISNNLYGSRPWVLPESLHPTTWTAKEMVRMIRRRDPTRPGFWYLSFAAPHPPLVPPATILEQYPLGINWPRHGGKWSREQAELPPFLASVQRRFGVPSQAERQEAWRAFAATCTHLDLQIGLVLAALREEGILSKTHILLISDHGDMLGHHGLWAKACFFDAAARVPFLLVSPPEDSRIVPGVDDQRLLGLQDVMPTLLELADVPIPVSVTGNSALGKKRRPWLWGEVGSAGSLNACRMVCDGRYKLIYYPVGNRLFFFDLENDPGETSDLAMDASAALARDRLTQLLRESLRDTAPYWLDADTQAFVGEPESEALAHDEITFHRSLALLRSLR